MPIASGAAQTKLQDPSLPSRYSPSQPKWALCEEAGLQSGQSALVCVAGIALKGPIGATTACSPFGHWMPEVTTLREHIIPLACCRCGHGEDRGRLISCPRCEHFSHLACGWFSLYWHWCCVHCGPTGHCRPPCSTAMLMERVPPVDSLALRTPTHRTQARTSAWTSTSRTRSAVAGNAPDATIAPG